MTGRSIRSRRDAIREREEQHQDLIAALIGGSDPDGQELGDRLRRCHEGRERRARWRDYREAATAGWPYRCRSLACWACRRAIVRTWQDRAAARFEDAENDDTSLITVSLARVSDIASVRAVVGKARRDLRNLRDSKTREIGGRRWCGMQAAGLVEVDALFSDDVPLLGIPTPRTALPG